MNSYEKLNQYANMFGALYQETKFRNKFQFIYNIVYYFRRLIFVGTGLVFEEKSTHQILTILTLNFVASSYISMAGA